MLPVSAFSLFDVAFMTCVKELFEHGALYGKRGLKHNP